MSFRGLSPRFWVAAAIVAFVVLVALIVGAAVLVPSLYYLFRVFKSGRTQRGTSSS